MPTSDAPTRIIITGSSGRIGRLLQAAWSAEPPADCTLVWCARSWGPWQDLLAGPLDPAPRGAVILHLAAELGDGPGAAARSVAMAQAIATAARQGRARHILLASSAAVYAPADTDLTEESPCAPSTPYGVQKLAAEHACRDASGNVSVTALRIGNVIGAGALLGASSTAGNIVLDPVPGTQAGPVRSWIAPAELGRVFGILAHLAVWGGPLPDALNLASPGAHGMASLLDAADLPWTFGPPRAGVLARHTLATARLEALCPRPTQTPAAMVADWRRTLTHRITA